MKRADEAVEKVLAGLRGVEVDAGFEERMVRRVRGAAREQGSAHWFGVWQWVGIGCVAMLLVGVEVSLRRQGKHDVVASNAGLGRETSERVGVAIGGGLSQRLKQGHAVRGQGAVLGVLSSRESFSGGVATRVKARTDDSRLGDSPEAAGALGAGFPAPPLPLTAQERLLLRAAERGDPQPAAVLEVSVLPTQDAEETAEFVEFFGQDRQVEQSTPGEKE